MDEERMLHPSWTDKSPAEMAADSRIFIFSCVIAGLIGILTIFYTAFQWRRNINLSWMKAVARSKKNPKAKHKVPVSPHTWELESVSRGKNLNCCACLKPMSPSQTLGPMIASDSFIHRCSICGAAAHLSCFSSAHKDCKCVSTFGFEHVMHQWAVRWTELTDQPDEAFFCSYYEEPRSGSFLGGSPIWCYLWCQRLLHVDCHSSMSNEIGDMSSTAMVYPDEEGVVFLCPLGWEENSGKGEGLTEEEINAFYHEYMKLRSDFETVPWNAPNGRPFHL